MTSSFPDLWVLAGLQDDLWSLSSASKAHLESSVWCTEPPSENPQLPMVSIHKVILEWKADQPIKE